MEKEEALVKETLFKEALELFIYEKEVKFLAKSRSDVLYYNSGANHASIVMESIFNTALSEIKIFAGNFNDEVCSNQGDRYVKALKGYLLKGKKLKVLLNDVNTIGSYNLILDVLKQYASSEKFKNNISVRTTVVKPKQDSFDIHFTVGDNSMYRLEYDTQKFLAEFSFNRPEKAKSLASRFDEIYETAKDFDLSKLPY